MAPNLFVAAKTACQPHHWFRGHSPAPSTDTRSASVSSLHTVQYSDHPTPGLYRHIPGCGWFLVATPRDGTSSPSSSTSFSRVEPPRSVVYSKVLRRFLFEEEFRERTKKSFAVEPETERTLPIGTPKWAANLAAHRQAGGFFRLDDGVSWVRCWDKHDQFLKGPWERYCWDEKEEVFRLMRVGDRRYGLHDEQWRRRRSEALGSGDKGRRSGDSRRESDGRRKESTAGTLHPDAAGRSRLGSTSTAADDTRTSSAELTPFDSSVDSVLSDKDKDAGVLDLVDEGEKARRISEGLAEELKRRLELEDVEH